MINQFPEIAQRCSEYTLRLATCLTTEGRGDGRLVSQREEEEAKHRKVSRLRCDSSSSHRWVFPQESFSSLSVYNLQQFQTLALAYIRTSLRSRRLYWNMTQQSVSSQHNDPWPLTLTQMLTLERWTKASAWAGLYGSGQEGQGTWCNCNKRLESQMFGKYAWIYLSKFSVHHRFPSVVVVKFLSKITCSQWLLISSLKATPFYGFSARCSIETKETNMTTNCYLVLLHKLKLYPNEFVLATSKSEVTCS